MEIVTANELLSGAVVYLSANGAWQMSLDAARVFRPDETEARDAEIERGKASGKLVGIVTETVSVVDGRPVPVRLRERIRAEGTTAPEANERQDLGARHVSL